MKKVFEKYPKILAQTETCTHSDYRGWYDAYWIRGLNDGNGEYPVVRDSEIASFLIQKLPDRGCACLRNAFAKLSFEDTVKLLENPDFSERKKEILLESRNFQVDKKEVLLSLRPHLGKIKNITFDLADLSNEEIVSSLSDMEKPKMICFKNFPTRKPDQKPLIQKLADMEYDHIEAKNEDDKYIDLQKMVDEERQKLVEEENAGKADWKVDFLKKCAVKDFKAALRILNEKGILSVRQETSTSNFGREFDLSPLGWGHNSLEVHNDLVAVDIKDMGDDTFAIGQIYEDRKWRSTVGYNSGIGWYWNGEVAVVNLEKGVGGVANTGTLCVRDPDDVSRDIFGNIPQKDFVSVRGNEATVELGSYASASVKKPEPDKTADKPAEKPKEEVEKTTPKKKRATYTLSEELQKASDLNITIKAKKDKQK